MIYDMCMTGGGVGRDVWSRGNIFEVRMIVLLVALKYFPFNNALDGAMAMCDDDGRRLRVFDVVIFVTTISTTRSTAYPTERRRRITNAHVKMVKISHIVDV